MCCVMSNHERRHFIGRLGFLENEVCASMYKETARDFRAPKGPFSCEVDRRDGPKHLQLSPRRRLMCTGFEVNSSKAECWEFRPEQMRVSTWVLTAYQTGWVTRDTPTQDKRAKAQNPAVETQYCQLQLAYKDRDGISTAARQAAQYAALHAH